MTAPDLTALADKLDELAMKATPGPWLPPEVIPPMGREAGWVLLRFNGEGYAWTDMPKQLTFNSEPRSRDEYLQDVADAELLIALRNALPQITTALREAARLREAPSEPGEFVGDIFYGNPVLTTEGTHRWTGSEWERLPSDVELLTKMLAASRSREMPAEMDHEMQLVWLAAWHEQSVARHKARFKTEQPISCEAAAWKAVVALIKGRAKVEPRAALKQEESRG